MYQYWPAPPIKTAGTCRRPSHAGLPATVAWQRSKASGKMKWVDTHKSTSILIFKQENKQHASGHKLKESSLTLLSHKYELRSEIELRPPAALNEGSTHREIFFFLFFWVYLSALKPNTLLSFSTRSFAASFLSDSSTPSAELGLPPDFSAESCSLWCCCTHAYSRLA